MYSELARSLVLRPDVEPQSHIGDHQQAHHHGCGPFKRLKRYVNAIVILPLKDYHKQAHHDCCGQCKREQYIAAACTKQDAGVFRHQALIVKAYDGDDVITVICMKQNT